MIQETRKLIDFEMLKPAYILGVFAPDADVEEMWAKFTGASSPEGDTATMGASGVASPSLLDNAAVLITVGVVALVVILVALAAGAMCAKHR